MRFLDGCIRNRISQVFLVGDIFDLWIADRTYFTREYQEIVVKIRQMIQVGIKVHYFEGNHDLDLRRFWQHQVGVDVWSDAAYFNIENYQVRVEHGDRMDPDDKGYLFLRWLLRTRPMVFLGRYLPNFLVAMIGRRASSSSRDYTTTVKSATDEEVRAKIRRHAERAFAESPFDVIVSGHVHVPEDNTIELQGREVRCINLGTWLKKPIALEINERTIELKSVDEIIDE